MRNRRDLAYPVSWALRASLFGTIVAGVLPAQVWTGQQLRENIAGFHEPGLEAQLSQIARLLEHLDDALPAVRALLQGNHREYLLKIEQLLDLLTDDRWSVREDAERRLVEIGARALGLIQERSQTGATLEERIRSARIGADIARLGTGEEDREKRLLRGLAAAAAYFPPDKQLSEALISAADHTDPVIVEGALRSLGFVGSDDHARFLNHRFRSTDRNARTARQTVLASLARLEGPESLAHLSKLISDGTLTRDELFALILDVRHRADSESILRVLASHEDSTVAAAAAVRFPPEPGDAEGARATIVLGSRHEFIGSIRELGSSIVTLDGQGEDLPVIHIAREQCNSIAFAGRESTVQGTSEPTRGLTARVFTTQGSLLIGTELEVDGEKVALRHAVFGRIEMARSSVQGVALDAGLDRLVGSSTNHDRIRLRDDSIADGQIERLEDNSLVLADGSRVALADVAGILFRRPSRLPRAPELFTRIDLRSGDRLLVHLAGATPTRLGFVMGGIGSAIVPLLDVARIEFGVGGGALWGFTLVADYSDNKIIEFDHKQNVVFELDEMYGVWDAECLDNGNLLIVEFALGRVVEMRRDRTEVWVYDNLKNPYDADRLPNGNTLIADTYSNRVIEVNASGEIVWSFEGQSKPLDVERLANGNTLIADGKHDRVIEVNPAGEIAWEQGDLVSVWDVDRLPNGNTLVTQRRSNHRVFEMDRDGKVVFEITDLLSPSDADRLPNGNTMVAEDGRVREFDRFGKVIWEVEVAWSVEVNRY